jgi:hypothetical protein
MPRLSVVKFNATGLKPTAIFGMSEAIRFMKDFPGYKSLSDQNLLPIGPKTRMQDPKETVLAAELRPVGRAFHGGQLLSKREVLQNDIKRLFESEKNVKEPVKHQLYYG